MAGNNGDDKADVSEAQGTDSADASTGQPERALASSRDLVRAAEAASRLVDSGFSTQVQEAMKAASTVSFGFSEEVRRALEAATQLDRSFSDQVRAVAEASQAITSITSPATELVAAMQANHDALRDSLASISGLSEQPWLRELEKTRSMLSRLDPAPWAASMKAGLDISRLAGLQEVLEAQAEATSRLAEMAPPVVSALREYERLQADQQVLEPDFDLLDAAVRAMPAAAHPRLPIEPAVEEPKGPPPARVDLMIDPAFNPVEAREILVWVRARGLPMTCACLDRKVSGDALALNVFRVLLELDHPDQEGLGLPTLVFECGECGRRVLHGVWKELRRAGGGLDVLEGGRAAGESPSTGKPPDLAIVPPED